MSRFIFSTFVALFFVSASAAHADIVNLVSSKDNTLYENASGSVSNGAGAFFFAGRTAQGANNLRRGVLAFDLSGIAPGSVINSVQLTLNMSRTISGASNVSLHRATSNWGEGASNAPGQEGAGAASQNNDATWIHTFFPGSNWTSAGGDFVGAASATTSVAGLGSYNWSSANLIADVQAWVDNPGTNFGWVVIGDEATSGSAKRFDTRENATAANRPLLTIDFTPIPEPGSIGFVGLLVIGALSAGRRKRR